VPHPLLVPSPGVRFSTSVGTAKAPMAAVSAKTAVEEKRMMYGDMKFELESGLDVRKGQ